MSLNSVQNNINTRPSNKTVFLMPHNKNHLNLTMPLNSDVYKTHNKETKIIKKNQSLERTTLSQQHEAQTKPAPRVVKSLITSNASTTTKTTRIVKSVLENLACTNTTNNMKSNTKANLAKNVNQDANGEVHSTINVKAHINEVLDTKHRQSRDLGKLSSTTAKGNNKLVKTMQQRIDKSDDTAVAQQRMSKTCNNYFDHYLTSAFDISTPEGLNKLEQHFFPRQQEQERRLQQQKKLQLLQQRPQHQKAQQAQKAQKAQKAQQTQVALQKPTAKPLKKTGRAADESVKVSKTTSSKQI